MLMTYGKGIKRMYIEWTEEKWGYTSEVGEIQLDDDNKSWWLFMKGSNTAKKYRKLSRAKNAALNHVRVHFRNGF